MNACRNTALTVELLFIISTVAGVISVALLGSLLTDPAYLDRVVTNANLLIIGTFLELICAAAFVAIAVVIFPILKRSSERVAVGYVVVRSFEAVPFIIGAISLFSLLTLGTEFVEAGVSIASHFQSLGALSLAVHDLTNALGSMIIFSLSALVLNYLLYQSRLVPQFISVWGLAGALLMLTAGVLGVYGHNLTSTLMIVLAFPLALQEMVFAVWLIAKGFNSSAIASRAA